MAKFFSIYFFMVFLSINVYSAEKTVTLYYNERPPYMVTGPGGEVTGVTASRAAKAIKDAGFTVKWKLVPTNRQLVELKQNESEFCGVGWFKNTERETFAKFTKAIYQDKPTVGIVRSDSGIQNGVKLSDLLKEKKIKLLVKDGFSYGPYIDELLKSFVANKQSTTTENADLIKMVSSSRADMLFASQEEADLLIQESKLSNLKFIIFADVLEGEKRYLICSKKMPDKIIEKINKKIKNK